MVKLVTSNTAQTSESAWKFYNVQTAVKPQSFGYAAELDKYVLNYAKCTTHPCIP